MRWNDEVGNDRHTDDVGIGWRWYWMTLALDDVGIGWRRHQMMLASDDVWIKWYWHQMMQESNDTGDQMTLQNSLDRCHSFVDKCVGNQKSFIHHGILTFLTMIGDKYLTN
jgi:hypothetical protein